MKFYFLSFSALLVTLFAASATAQSVRLSTDNYVLQLPEGTVRFDIDGERVVIKFNRTVTDDVLADRLARLGLFKPFERTWKVPFPDLVVAEFNADALKMDYSKRLENLQNDPSIEFVAPALMYGNLPQYVYDLFFVKATNAAELGILNRYAELLGFEVRNEHFPGIFSCYTNKQSTGNAFEIAKYLQQLSVFEFAEPDFVYTCNPATNDPSYAQQWSLNNTGQFSGTPGSDVEALNAWNITTGSTSIKVAILDCFGSTAQFTHPDITFFATHDATGTGFNSSGFSGDAHGICCAGLVAATGNNNAGGVGVAYTSKVIAVKLGTIINSSGSWNSTGSSISNGITWAYQNADVISNSNTFGSSSSVINTAITNGNTLGRGGKGTPFLSSAGNSNSTTLGYPASYANTIAVGASSPCDQRKSTTSCDGETWWGSDYGTGLDIAAPGVKMYTTDLAGTPGYSTTDYSASFNGTSSACPMAAGVMALVLSANSNLTYTNARYILESTCEKVGGYSYAAGVSGQPNGTWTSQLGYGRVNAYQAVLAAVAINCTTTVTPAVSIVCTPSNSVCAGTNVMFTASPVNGGAAPSYQWKVNGTNVGTNSSSYANSALTNGDQVSVVMTSSNVCASPSSANSNTVAMTVNGVGLGTLSATPSSVCAAGSSTLQAQPVYCTPTTSCTYPDIISNVTFAGINRNSACDNTSGGFSFFPSQNPTLVAGASYALSVTTSGDKEGVAVWIDYNKDGTFQSTEMVMNGFLNTNPATYTATVTVPASAINGSTRMRVRCIYNANPTSLAIPACSNTTYGETEDYTVTISGGAVNPVTYSWSPATNLSSTATNPTTAAGLTTSTTYTLTATNAGCSVSGTVAVTVNALILSGSVNNAMCYGGSNGSITVSVTGGVLPYSYQWNTGAATQSISGLAAGSYTVTVTEANGCSASLAYSVAQPQPLGASFSSTAVSCNGQSNGSIAATVSGGTSPYAYAWSNGASTTSISGLAAGTYALTVTDVNGCMATGSAAVQQPQSISTSTSSTASCFSTSTGSASVTTSGGTSPYSVLWSNGQTNTTAVGLSPGTYGFTVTDINGCTASGTASVGQLAQINVTISGNTVIIAGGTTTLNAGTGYTTYNWSTGATTQTISTGTAGTYTVTVTNSSGCTASASVTVTVTQNALSVSVSSTNATCNGQSNGSATATASGGVTPYQYNWNNGQTTASMSNLAAGTYSVTVTDNSGNTASANTIVTQPAPSTLAQPGTIIVTGGSAAVCPGDVRTYTITAVSGATSYTWTAPSGATITSGQGTTSVQATYSSGFTANGTLSVIAANACTTSVARTLSVVRNNPATPSVITGPATAVCVGTTKNYSVTNVSGMTYVWSASNTNATFTAGQGTNAVTVSFGSAFTSTTLSVKAQNGCGLSTARTLAVYSTPLASAAIAVSGGSAAVCPGDVRTYTATAVSGATGYVWTLPNGASAPSLTTSSNSITVTYGAGFTASGTLTVKAQNACGIGAVKSLTIARYAPAQPSVITGPSTLVCAGSTQSYSVINVAGMTYNWTFSNANATVTNGQGTNAVTVTFGGAFTSGTLSVKASFNCGTSVARTLAVYSKPTTQPAAIVGQYAGNCGASNAYSTTAVAGLTYTWSTTVAGATITNGPAPGNAVTVTWPASGFSSGLLSVSAVNACGAGPARTLTVYGFPQTLTGITGPTAVCSNEQHAYTAAAMFGAVSYAWTIPSGASFVGASNTQSVTVQFGTTSGNVTARAVNACGNGGVKTIAIVVSTCSGRLDESDQNNLTEMQLYPNPASDRINVVLPRYSGDATLSVIDALGRNLQTVEVNETNQPYGTELEIALDEYAAGVYHIRLVTGQGTETLPFVKQ